MFDMFHSAITRGWFSAGAVAIWDDRGTLDAWIAAELALAQAQGELGIIPAETHARMREAVRVERFDLEQMAAEIGRTLHPLVPFLRQFEAMCPPDVAGRLHWGITTQNVFETGSALQLKQTHALLMADLDACIGSLSRLARRHARTLQAARTHGQHALPTTFGYRVGGWALELRRQRQRLDSLAADALVARFGGGAGTYGAMAGRGREVQARAAAILGLGSAPLVSRTNFDGTASYVAGLGVLAGLVEKIAAEIAFLQRTEIGEAAEPFAYGMVGSSTMAQKRNPARCNNLIGVARLLRARVPLILDSLVRLNDADAASSNVADVTLPEVAVMGASLAETLAEVVAGLSVDTAKMRANLELTQGLIMSEAVMMELAPAIGRGAAHHVLYDTAAQVLDHGAGFAAALAAHPDVAAQAAGLDINAITDPTRYVQEIIDWIENEVDHDPDAD